MRFLDLMDTRAEHFLVAKGQAVADLDRTVLLYGVSRARFSGLCGHAVVVPFTEATA